MTGFAAGRGILRRKDNGRAGRHSGRGDSAMPGSLRGRVRAGGVAKRAGAAAGLPAGVPAGVTVGFGGVLFLVFLRLRSCNSLLDLIY